MDSLDEAAPVDPWQGLTPSGQKVLMVLDAVGTESASKLATRLGTSPDDLTDDLVTLHELGYVRELQPADEPSYEVTDAGHTAIQAAVSELHRRITDSE